MPEPVNFSYHKIFDVIEGDSFRMGDQGYIKRSFGNSHDERDGER